MRLKAWLVILFITSVPTILVMYFVPGLDIFSGGVTTGPSVGICFLNPELPCVSQGLSSPVGNLSIEITNLMDKPMEVKRISCSSGTGVLFGCSEFPPGGVQTVCDLGDPSADRMTIKPGDSNDFSLQCTDDNGNPIWIAKGGSYTGKINLEYIYPAGSNGSATTIHGDIVQEAS